jgi:LDH2 family malate/lactate/ureidoglycolate dehydrogenase
MVAIVWGKRHAVIEPYIAAEDFGGTSPNSFVIDHAEAMISFLD